MQDNKRNGYGKSIYESGDSYEGEWKNNNKHGIGIYKDSKGEVYIGQWLNNNREGLGKGFNEFHFT